MAGLLSQGSRGYDVAVAQLQLNVKGASPKLKVDGAFGPLTRTAVIAFQKKSGLVGDGIIGPKTQAALAVDDKTTKVHHLVKHIPQPTSSTCWAASTAMMTNSTVEAVKAKTPASMISSNGGLLNSSGSDQAIVTGTQYGNIHGLKCYAPMSWMVPAFVALIKRSPLMIDMLWNASDYAQGMGSPGHMVVISAVVSDNDQTGKGTHLLILDPWAPGVGKIYWVDYYTWVNDVPTRTYRVFDKK